MEKDNSILKFLSDIENTFNKADYNVLNDWEDDLMAIGLCSSYNINRVIYVQTFKRGKNKYYYDCDLYKDYASDIEYETIESGDNISFEKIIPIIEKHLEIKRK